LSLGERMKMELIGAIIHWPQVIFLDEPTIGLDVLAAHNLREFLRVFNQREKATIILTSHNMEDIERLCSRVLILRSGELIYDGRPDGLTGKGERELRVRFLRAPGAAELAQVTGLPATAIHVGAPPAGPADEEESGADAPPAAHFTVQKDQIVAVLQRLMQKYEIVDMGIQEQSLEAVIQRLYAEDRLA
ncbi:MAG TPA: ABC transporter, partial [Bdellovibrionota bacterium]|nr:ABC transporter [Bdellovibrionota bacterium]